MEKKKFDLEKIEFFLKDEFKSLTKEYMLKCMFDEDIQKTWYPRVGDIIIGCTGNIFVISGKSTLHETLGGDMFFYGGSSCNRNGGNFLDSTMCYTMNESGINYKRGKLGKLIEVNDLYHSSYKDYRYVPYPHEISK